MWAYFLANYSKLGLMLLGLLIAVKLLLTIFFHNYHRNVVGVVSHLFKWYGVVDRDLAENNLERLSMRLQNLATIIICLVATALLFMLLLFN